MRIYCSICDKVQPVVIDNCRDAKTGEPYQDIVCKECHLVIASGTDIQPVDEPFGYFQYSMRMDAWVQNRDNDKGVAFYTRPQPAAQWVGLTDEEIKALASWWPSYDQIPALMVLARDIENSLKDKNQSIVSGS